MFPWVYGFTWDAGNIIFLGTFFAVVAVVAGTVTLAAFRAYRNHKLDMHEKIRWMEDFHDLPRRARTCRHVLTGELAHRTCPNGFDCRGCEKHSEMLERPGQGAAAVAAEGEPALSGAPAFTLPLDRLYHRGHTWVRMEEDGVATIGLDDFAIRLLGTPEHVELPPVGSRIRVNGPGWRMKRNGSTVRVLAPVDGEVVETGNMQEGWYLKVRPLGPQIDTRHLLHGREVHAWISAEMDRLRRFLGGAEPVPTMADGGEPVADFTKSQPHLNWDAIWGEMLLEP